MTADIAVATGVAAALAAAGAFGGSAVLQYRANHHLPREPAGKPSLLLHLIRLRGWRWSIVLAVIGFGLQVLALRMAPLILVQPLLVTGVLWYAAIGALLLRQHADRTLLGGAVVCLTGLAAFLLLARPESGSGADGAITRLVPIAVVLAAVVVACLTLSATIDRRWRALPLALAAGVCYGTTAALVRSVSGHFSAGLGHMLAQWQTYAICLLGPIGVLLSQNSYQAGRVGVPALTVITVTDPLASIALGVVWLGEPIHATPALIAGEAGSMALVIAGVAILASRAPHVRPEA